MVSTAGYLIVNCGSAHAPPRAETLAPSPFLQRFSPRFDLSRAAYDTREVLCAFDVSGGADYGGLIIDDDKNLTRKMFRGENSENTRATYGHGSRL